MNAESRWSMPRMIGAVLLATLVFVAAALLAPLLLDGSGVERTRGEGESRTVAGAAPWEIRPIESGSISVFGLDLGRSTLADAMRRWPGDAVAVALLRAPDGRFSLEGYVESMPEAQVQGKLVLGTSTSPAALAAWADRATREQILPTGARRLDLHPDDRPLAMQQVIDNLSFLPSARLDEATLEARFGPADERKATPDGMVHLLHPARGLAISLASEGRQRIVLQYVAPREFERLREPLLRASASAAGS